MDSDDSNVLDTCVLDLLSELPQLDQLEEQSSSSEADLPKVQSKVVKFTHRPPPSGIQSTRPSRGRGGFVHSSRNQPSQSFVEAINNNSVQKGVVFPQVLAKNEIKINKNKTYSVDITRSWDSNVADIWKMFVDHVEEMMFSQNSFRSRKGFPVVNVEDLLAAVKAIPLTDLYTNTYSIARYDPVVVYKTNKNDPSKKYPIMEVEEKNRDGTYYYIQAVMQWQKIFRCFSCIYNSLVEKSRAFIATEAKNISVPSKEFSVKIEVEKGDGSGGKAGSFLDPVKKVVAQKKILSTLTDEKSKRIVNEAILMTMEEEVEEEKDLYYEGRNLNNEAPIGKIMEKEREKEKKEEEEDEEGASSSSEEGDFSEESKEEECSTKQDISAGVAKTVTARPEDEDEFDDIIVRKPITPTPSVRPSPDIDKREKVRKRKISCRVEDERRLDLKYCPAFYNDSDSHVPARVCGYFKEYGVKVNMFAANDYTTNTHIIGAVARTILTKRVFHHLGILGKQVLNVFSSDRDLKVANDFNVSLINYCDKRGHFDTRDWNRNLKGPNYQIGFSEHDPLFTNPVTNEYFSPLELAGKVFYFMNVYCVGIFSFEDFLSRTYVQDVVWCGFLYGGRAGSSFGEASWRLEKLDAVNVLHPSCVGVEKSEYIRDVVYHHPESKTECYIHPDLTPLFSNSILSLCKGTIKFRVQIIDQISNFFVIRLTRSFGAATIGYSLNVPDRVSPEVVVVQDFSVLNYDRRATLSLLHKAAAYWQEDYIPVNSIAVKYYDKVHYKSSSPSSFVLKNTANSLSNDATCMRLSSTNKTFTDLLSDAASTTGIAEWEKDGRRRNNIHTWFNNSSAQWFTDLQEHTLGTPFTTFFHFIQRSSLRTFVYLFLFIFLCGFFISDASTFWQLLVRVVHVASLCIEYGRDLIINLVKWLTYILSWTDSFSLNELVRPGYFGDDNFIAVVFIAPIMEEGIKHLPYIGWFFATLIGFCEDYIISKRSHLPFNPGHLLMHLGLAYFGLPVAIVLHCAHNYLYTTSFYPMVIQYLILSSVLLTIFVEGLGGEMYLFKYLRYGYSSFSAYLAAMFTSSKNDATTDSGINLMERWKEYWYLGTYNTMDDYFLDADLRICDYPYTQGFVNRVVPPWDGELSRNPEIEADHFQIDNVIVDGSDECDYVFTKSPVQCLFTFAEVPYFAIAKCMKSMWTIINVRYLADPPNLYASKHDNLKFWETLDVSWVGNVFGSLKLTKDMVDQWVAKQKGFKGVRAKRSLEVLKAAAWQRLQYKVNVMIKEDEIFVNPNVFNEDAAKGRMIFNVPNVITCLTAPIYELLTKRLKAKFTFRRQKSYVVNGKRFWLTVACGFNAGDLTEWMRFVLNNKKDFHVIVSGDDSLSWNPELNHWNVSDFSKFDQSQSSAVLSFCSRFNKQVLKGDPEIIDLMEKVHSMPLFVPYTRESQKLGHGKGLGINRAINPANGKGYPCRDSGGANTSHDNSIVNIVTWVTYYAFYSDEEPEKFFRQKTGLCIKYRTSCDMRDIDFLKGTWYKVSDPRDDYEYTYAPLPSRFLKLGKSLKDTTTLFKEYKKLNKDKLSKGKQYVLCALQFLQGQALNLLSGNVPPLLEEFCSRFGGDLKIVAYDMESRCMREEILDSGRKVAMGGDEFVDFTNPNKFNIDREWAFELYMKRYNLTHIDLHIMCALVSDLNPFNMLIGHQWRQLTKDYL